MNLLTNIPIFRRLFYAFILAAVIPGVIISILGVTFINSVNARSQALQITVNAVQDSAATGDILEDLNGQPALPYQDWARLGFHASPGKLSQTVSNARNLELQFANSVAQYQQNYQINTSPQMRSIQAVLASDDPNAAYPDAQQKALNQLTTVSWPAYKSALDRVLNSMQLGISLPANSYTEVSDKYTALRADWKNVEKIAGQVSNAVARAGNSQTHPIILATLVAFLGTIMVVITIFYFVNLTITRPLRELATLTRRIAKGETNARAKIIGRDEIYMVATSMNSMLDNIVRLIQETQSQRDVLQAQVEKLVSEVSGVGEGDLRVQAEVTADALGVLADSFNYMVEELGSLVVRVKMVANEVENSTAAILDRMTQLVEAGDIQITEISDAAADVERMSSWSRQVAERSQVLYDVASSARQDAQGGREALKQAVEGMSRINDNVQTTAGRVQTLGERSREINEIVEVISSIAHQTNRLALDAAIQAAMAGDNGKGFGAVAADIRRLAERAKDQASIITRIVRSVREDIGSVAISMQDTERETAAGSRLTQEAGVALEAIFAAVEHQAREIENINQVAVQQLQASSAVVRIMHSVSETTQQSSVNTRDASQNMERLARLVEQLRASVEAFKLRENQDYVVPNTGMNISLDEDPENPLSMSGVFRTISATAQPAQLLSGTGVSSSSSLNELLPEHTNDPFSFYPLEPGQANNPPPSNNTSWSGEWDPTLEEQWSQRTNGNGRGW